MNKKGDVITKIILGVLIVLILGIGSLLATAIVTKENPINYFSASGGQSSVVVNVPQVQSMLTQEQAISIASQTIAGVVSEVELIETNGQLIYVVEVKADGVETEIKIDAYQGTVLSVVQETELGKQELEVINPQISQDQAIAFALAQVPGTFVEVDAENEDGVYLYDVEIIYNGEEYSVDVDMMTGVVLSIERELISDGDEDDDDEDVSITLSSSADTSSSSGPVTLSEAKEIALNRVGGRVTDTEMKNSGRIYEIEIQKNGDEYDVLVERSTGKLLDVERD